MSESVSAPKNQGPNTKGSNTKSSKKISTEPAKGMRDFLPKETLIRDTAISIILDTYRAYGFERIETPIIEDLSRLLSGDGGENLRMLFKILKRGEKLDLTKPNLTEDDIAEYGLRFDLTVPLVRYFVQHQAQLPKPFKSIQIGPVFRAERPQRGRYRQFYQSDIDIIGDRTLKAELELAAVTSRAMNRLGFTGTKVKVNDRRILTAMANYAEFDEAAHSAAFVILDKLDKVGIAGVREELTRKQFALASVDKLCSLLELYASPSDHVPPQLIQLISKFAPPSESGRGVFEDIQEILKSGAGLLAENSAFVFDLTLVRGMGYYTGPIFEMELAEFPGLAAAGGGRYDNLVGKLTGLDAPACGFSIGLERVALVLEEHPGRLNLNPIGCERIALFTSKEIPFTEAFTASEELRHQGHQCAIFESPNKLHAKLEQLKSQGYTAFAKYEGGRVSEIRRIE